MHAEVEGGKDVSDKTMGIILLVLGIVTLIWPSFAYIVVGVGLIAIGVLLLMGKMTLKIRR